MNGLLCRIFLAAFSLFAFTSIALADVGIVVYQSKGGDTRLSGAGHIALITTRLCPAGTSHLRHCRPGEDPGAVITHYPNIASGYRSSLFAVPLRDHFTATRLPGKVPVLSDGASLESMQLDYWRRHLQSSLPPLSLDQYQALREEQARFNAGRIFRRTITMQYLFQLLGPRDKRAPTEPIAMVDPRTQRLIPEGRWRDAIGVQYVRSSVIITARTSPEQEERLLHFIAEVPDAFNALSNNCSDFVAHALTVVFHDSGFGMRPRAFDPANVWITSPISVSTNFLRFARSRHVAIEVEYMPMIEGTRRASAPGSSISRGMLVPDARQGKLGFGVRVFINYLNPLLGLTALGLDKASGYADLQGLVHQRGSRELSRLANEVALQPAHAAQDHPLIQREQVRVFGTSACWQTKRQQFSRMEQQAVEAGVISPDERSLMLRQGQPYLLSRYYEALSKDAGADGILTAGMWNCSRMGCANSPISYFLPSTLGSSKLPSDLPDGFVPNRAQLGDMARSGNTSMEVTAFRLVTSVINYDLSSEPLARRTATSFDPDWQLFLDVAEANALLVPEPAKTFRGVEACSIAQLSAAPATTDAYHDALSPKNRIAREGRDLFYSAAR